MSARLTALVALLATVTALLPGCSEVDAHLPPAITYGVSVCADCGMIISDERYATALVVQDERGRPEALLFDDAGDQIIYEREIETGTVLARWVHDHQSHAWLRAESAWYVRAQSLPTPMASGIAAFEKQADAKRMAGELGGVVLTYEQLWFAPAPKPQPE